MEFNLTIRGQRDDNRRWHHIYNQTVNQSAVCHHEFEICSWIQLADIEVLDFSTYDVAIAFTHEEAEELDKHTKQAYFRLAYISEEFTYHQLIITSIWSVISFVVMVVYCHKICKTSKRKITNRITGEMNYVCFLLVLLFFFNDPYYYIAYVYTHKPGMYMWVMFHKTLFMTALFVFWIKDVSLQKFKIPNKKTGN